MTLSRWWQDKQGEVSASTAADYLWRLELLLGFRPDTVTADIDAAWVDELCGALVSRKARNRKGGQTLSPSSVNMVLGVLGQALDLAVDHGLLVANPSRGSGCKAKAAKPRRTFLEADMVRDLLDAAGEWEADVPAHQRYGRRALLALLCLAGPRIGEAINANRGDFDFTQAGGESRSPRQPLVSDPWSCPRFWRRS
jgi:integrase